MLYKNSWERRKKFKEKKFITLHTISHTNCKKIRKIIEPTKSLRMIKKINHLKSFLNS